MPPVRLFLGSLGLLGLLGCLDSHFHGGPSSGYVVNAVAVSDLDRNGLPDLLGLVSTSQGGMPTPGYVSVRSQTSAGVFAAPLRLGVGTDPANLLVADLNGDGRPDLVVANAQEQTLGIRLADPARPGAFLPALVLATPGRRPLDVAVGDLDGDGRMDLVVAASGARSILVYLQGPAPGSFQAPLSFSVGGDPQAVTVADLDGDGHPDIAVATGANTVSILRQLVFSPTFAAQSAVDYATGIQPVAIRAVDLNGDGRLDLLTANYGAAYSPGNQGLSVLLQAAPGTFAAPVHYLTDYRASGLAVGDLNGDGRPDVVVACSGLPGASGSVSVLLQSPAAPGALQPATNLPGVSGPMGVALADMDGDGRLDLVLADGDLVVRLNSPTAPGTFGPPKFFYN